LKGTKTVTNKKTSIFITILFTLSLLLTACTTDDQPLPAAPSSTVTKPEPVIVEVTAVGDFLMHMPVINAAWDNSINDYNFNTQLDPVKNLLAEPDLTIANLETRLAGQHNGGYSGYPIFNCPEKLAYDLKAVGVDVMTTANNHSLDRGFNGITATLDNLEAAGLKPVGNYKTPEDKNTPLIIDVKGINIGILNYTDSTNGIPIPDGKEYAINMVNLEAISQEVQQLKSAGADVLVMYLHFGIEYQRQPNDQQKQLVDKLFALGIDIIFGDHVHVIQPMEKRLVTFEGKEKEVFVIYSLGNFISNQRWQYSDSGVIVNVQLEKNLEESSTTIKKVDYIPTWVHTYISNGNKYYRVVAVEKAIRDYEQQLDSTITVTDYQRLLEVWQETTSHLTKEDQNILPRAVQ
jgi:poly-gamma-glutamate synthesis protein (capsule biosynthesis protein)